MNKPPTTSALRKYAKDLLAGREGDWDVFHFIEDNPIYKAQLDQLLREPAKQRAYEAEVKAKAATDALNRLRSALKRTCRRYRSTRKQRLSLHHNRQYLSLLRLKRNELEKQNKWDKFVVDVQMLRISQAMDWIDRRHSQWMSDVILSSNPFELVEAWPEGSKCVIDPQMSPEWVLLKPPTPPTVIEVERSLRKRLLAYERALEAAYYKTLGITKPKPKVISTDSNGIRTETTADSGHTASPLLTAEQWMEKQLRPEVPPEEGCGEEGL